MLPSRGGEGGLAQFLRSHTAKQGLGGSSRVTPSARDTQGRCQTLADPELGVRHFRPPPFTSSAGAQGGSDTVPDARRAQFLLRLRDRRRRRRRGEWRREVRRGLTVLPKNRASDTVLPRSASLRGATGRGGGGPWRRRALAAPEPAPASCLRDRTPGPGFDGTP